MDAVVITVMASIVATLLAATPEVVFEAVVWVLRWN